MKCEVKPDEDIKAFTLKAIVKMYYSSMLIFQGQGFCSEVLFVWNYLEEKITKTSEEWNLLKS